MDPTKVVTSAEFGCRIEGGYKSQFEYYLVLWGVRHFEKRICLNISKTTGRTENLQELFRLEIKLSFYFDFT